GLARADSYRLVDAEHEDLAVTDLAGLGRAGNGFDHFVDLVGRNRDFDLQLREETDGVFGAAIDFSVAFLTAITFDFSNSESRDADGSQSVADLVELEWL